MIRMIAIAAVAAAGWACATTGRSVDRSASVEHPLLGVWRALRYETWDSTGGRLTPFGDPPSVYAVFSPEGVAFIQLMRTVPASGTSVEADPSLFAAYYGPYSIDPSGQSVTIRVEGTNLASYVGTEQRRPFRISRDTLFLGVPGQYQATLIRSRPAE